VKIEDPVVEPLRKALRDRSEIRLALLFGSRSRGKARPDSDADVAVLGENLDILELAADLSDAAKVEVHVVDIKDPGYPLLNALLRDGIVLREGERGAAASWWTRGILQAETDRPGYERMRDSYLRRLAKGLHG
jgi:predicted nucleotidyltransferase